MSYTTQEGRLKVLDDLSAATGQIAVALACLGEAYELLDEHLADELEAQLFSPVQAAYGRARRTHTEFAARHALSPSGSVEGSSGPHDHDPRVYLRRALDACVGADALIGELQDSMLPVEVGDRELREGLAATRELISGVPHRGGELLRSIGR